jgi:hypothetical protein
MPRYFPGRNILVKTHVNPLIESKQYSIYDSKIKETYVTHNATLVGRKGKSFVAEVKGCDMLIEVPIEETLILNQPQTFDTDVNGNIILEDSLIFNVKGHSEKLKLLEMAFKLAPIA